MPAKPEGVYSDKRGQWYFKVSLGKDLLTGTRAADSSRISHCDRSRQGAPRGPCKVRHRPTPTIKWRAHGRRPARPLPRRHRC